MGLREFLFEQVETEPTQDLATYLDTEETISDVDTSNLSQANLVTEIYEKNNYGDYSKSIFKAEEVINSLPKEMATDTKRMTVLSILGSFGLNADMVSSDGVDRINLLQEAFDEIESKEKSVISENEAEIESLKIQIQNLEKINMESNELISHSKAMIETETKRLSNLIDFLIVKEDK